MQFFVFDCSPEVFVRESEVGDQILIAFNLGVLLVVQCHLLYTQRLVFFLKSFLFVCEGLDLLEEFFVGLGCNFRDVLGICLETGRLIED